MSPTPEETNDPRKDPEGDEITSSNVADGPNFIPIQGSDSESDDDDAGIYEGYQPLPQEPVPMGHENAPPSPSSHLDHALQSILNHDADSSIGAVASSIFQESTEVDPRDRLASDLWNNSQSQEVKTEMAPEQADEIKKAMKGIVLSPNCLPDWAKNVSEDEWKSKLLSQLHGSTGNKS